MMRHKFAARRVFGGSHDDEGGHRGRCQIGRGEEWSEGWGGHHRRHGRQRVLDASALRLVLLKLIADAPRHGYDLIQAIAALTGGGYAPSPGVVYPALAMLEDQGLIVPSDSDGARKAFAITEAGTAEIVANAQGIEALLARLSSLAQMAGRLGAAPVRRAMENLRGVLRATLSRGELNKDRAHDVAAILDAAAQQIERLT